MLSPSSTTQLVSWNPRYTTPYVQEWNLSIQKQLPWHMVWETSYVGNNGTHLWGQTEGNQPLTNGPGAPNTRRPLAQYTIASIKAFRPWNRSTYEGMSTHLEKRFSHRRIVHRQLHLGAAPSTCRIRRSTLATAAAAATAVQNAYNRDGQKGPSDKNVPLRFAIGGNWELPFGPGHPLLDTRMAEPRGRQLGIERDLFGPERASVHRESQLR